jgi:hypothetical protein
MKKLILITVLVATLAALLAGTALAAGPATSTAQGFGPGTGIHAPGTGLATPGMGAGGMARWGAPEWAGESEAVQALLGMTAEQIQAERLAGKSLAQIAAGKGVSEDELISAILEAKKADLAKLVADGKLTQAQADLMIQNMQAQVKTMVERTSVGPVGNQSQGRTGGMMGQGFRGGRSANR